MASPATKCLLARGELSRLVKEVSARAYEKGALLKFHSEERVLKEGSIDVQMRILGSLEEKMNATKKQAGGEKRNPFLPYEEDLFVTELTPSHIVLLNKFAVLPDHGLIVTRDFVDQEEPLLLEDFVAIHLALQEEDALVFFNCGRIAGASQPHKHLQFIPLPLSLGSTAPHEPSETPLSHLIDEDLALLPGSDDLRRLECFAFEHLLVKERAPYHVDLISEKASLEYAERHFSLYTSMLRHFARTLEAKEHPEAVFGFV